jgi:hypothetical protein
MGNRLEFPEFFGVTSLFLRIIFKSAVARVSWSAKLFSAVVPQSERGRAKCQMTKRAREG